VGEIPPFFIFIIMSTEQSQFSKLPKRQLIRIIEKLVDEDFPTGNPYDHDYDSLHELVEGIGSYYNIDAMYEDVEFFSKLLEINQDLVADLFANQKRELMNKDLYNKLIIPVANTYKVNYTVNGTCTYTEFYAQNFTSYDEDWVKDLATQQHNDGSWDMYDGITTSKTDYDNWEMNDYDLEDVELVDDRIEKIKESILKKLSVESTSGFINSLDKKSLLELRRVIDSKLRLL